jgi:hypothetical protein
MHVMSNASTSSDGLSAVELDLAKALALIHKTLPRLETPGLRTEVQTALSKAIALMESARSAHAGGAAAVVPLGSQAVSTGVPPRIAAVIAAAVSVALDQPYRLVAVQQVTAPVVPHLNVWAVEGRTQIFMSHRVR